ncbi:MAG: hypothetical protein OHK0022_53670 [Roseiflexaceae bacterium]
MVRALLLVLACLMLAACRFNGAASVEAPQLASTEPTHAPLPPTRVATPQPLPSPTPSATLTPTPAPSPTPAPTAMAGYAGHVVAEGETLEQIAAAGGSTPELIQRYNLLDGMPAGGRMLIVPQLDGQQSLLPNRPLLVRRGSGERPWVALTLDAGAGAAPVPGMLQTLRQRGVRLTFFLTGAWVRAHPELTRQIVADGHEIANHSMSHPDMTRLDDAAIRAELAETEALVQQVAGVTTRPFFRPPYGAYSDRVLEQVQREGYLPVYWTLDSLDSVGKPKTAAFLVRRVTGTLSPEQLRGAIILAHCGSPATAEALPRILDRFDEMGFAVKKLSEVLGD